MRRSRRNLLVVAAAVLVPAALVGYLAGHLRAAHQRPEAFGEIANGASSIEYSRESGWRAAPTAPPIPGLLVIKPLSLAPGGDPARAGMIVGQAAEGSASPLPATFLARLGTLPRVEVVYLEEGQAYKYSQIVTSAPAERMTIYAMPNSTTQGTLIACYSRSGPGALRACEGLVNTMSLSGVDYEAFADVDLTPDADYARHVSSTIERVEGLRSSLAGRSAPGARIARLANGIARGLSGAIESLSAIQPARNVSNAQAALVGSLRELRAAYMALAKAATAESQSAYTAARARLQAGQAAVDRVLTDFTLLGYA